jgi:hypothetical protein
MDTDKKVLSPVEGATESLRAGASADRLPKIEWIDRTKNRLQETDFKRLILDEAETSLGEVKIHYAWNDPSAFEIEVIFKEPYSGNYEAMVKYIKSLPYTETPVIVKYVTRYYIMKTYIHGNFIMHTCIKRRGVMDE